MSSQLHVVLSVEPELARGWTDDEVADCWGRLFPLADSERQAARRERLVAMAEMFLRISVERDRSFRKVVTGGFGKV